MTPPMREYRYRVDTDGRVFHEDTEILDPPVLRFFLRAMTRTADGRWLCVCQGERNWFDAGATPFVVQRLRTAADVRGLSGVELRLAGDYAEPLDPASLDSEGGQLFCRVRKGAFRARFGRVALQQLAPFLVDDGSGPGLLMGGIRYPINEAVSSAAPDAITAPRGVTG